MKNTTIGKNVGFSLRDKPVEDGLVIDEVGLGDGKWFKVKLTTDCKDAIKWVNEKNIICHYDSIKDILGRSYSKRRIQNKGRVEDFRTYCFSVYKRSHLLQSEDPISFNNWLSHTFKGVNKLKKKS